MSLGWAQTLQGDPLHKSLHCKTDYLSVLANIFIVTCSEVCDSFQAKEHFRGFLQVDSIGYWVQSSALQIPRNMTLEPVALEKPNRASLIPYRPGSVEQYMSSQCSKALQP